MWLEKPAPGSKKPEPSVDVPVTSEPIEQLPAATVSAAEGVAGGGACSWITLTPHELLELAYSWKVQKVMLSLGSTTVWE